MPVVYTPVDISEVRTILKNRGYGFNSDWRYPLQLNVPSKDPKKVRAADNQPYRERLRGIAKAELNEILMRASDAQSAADLIERMSTGETLSGVEEVRVAADKPAFDAVEVERIIENRVNMAFVRMSSEINERIADLASKIDEMIAKATVDARPAVTDALPQARRRGRPKGSKNRPKSKPEIDKVLKTMGLDSVQRPSEADFQ